MERLVKLFSIVSLVVGAQQAVAMGGSQTISPRDAIDFNPDPNIVEVVLVAHENVVDFGTGNTTAVYTYNGGIPGPTIRGKVGDRLIVHFYNKLPEPTTVHWHGLELPANQDGSFLSQLPVEPYQYKRYEFDLNVASLFWYHPHIRSDEQIEKGLYGALMVEDPAANAELDLPQSEHLLVLDDVLLDDNGQVAEHFSEMADPLARTKQILDGREGNLKTVNGETQPTVKVTRFQPQRLRVVNTANATFMRLSISGHSGHTMYRIGGDGGLLETPLKLHPIGCADDGGGHDGHEAAGDDSESCMSDPDVNKGVMLTPGERADIVFTPMGNDPIRLEWHDIRKGRHTASYDDMGNIVLSHAHGDGAAPKEVLMTFKPTGSHKGEAYVPPAELRDIPELVADVTEPLVLKFGHTQPDANGDVKLFVQDIGKPFVEVTPGDAYDLEVGKTYIWETWNMTGGIHNFHPHGFAVQLIETVYVDMEKPEGEQMVVVPAPYLEWKDTVAMPARPGAPMKSRTVQRYAMKIDDTGREGQVAASGKIPTDDESGGWLLHCHINEHSRNGMGTFFEVFEPAE